jgi:NSS family neurotransmitter:Na+ symporter
MLSLVEVPVAFLNERCKMSRKMATVVTVVLIGVVGSTAALSNSLMANFTLFGKTMFDLFDFSTSNVLLPVGGLLLAVFAGWVWGRKAVFAELTNAGTLQNTAIVKAFFFVIRFVTPLLVLLILLHGLGVF